MLLCEKCTDLPPNALEQYKVKCNLYVLLVSRLNPIRSMTNRFHLSAQFVTAPNDPQMTWNATRSKLPHIPACSTLNPRTTPRAPNYQKWPEIYMVIDIPHMCSWVTETQTYNPFVLLYHQHFLFLLRSSSTYYFFCVQQGVMQLFSLRNWL